MHFDLFGPVLDVVKGSAVVNGVGEDDAHGPSIVCLSYCLEALLSRSVPNLKLHSVARHVQHFSLEINAWMRDFIPMVERWEV
jgi:hypothetical protein